MTEPHSNASRTTSLGLLIAGLAIALGLRLAWIAVTSLTAEDAYITFKYSQRLAAGQGFVYNLGEPVLGTTSPPFALLLAGWLKLFPNEIVTGARLFDLAAVVAALVCLWHALGRLGLSDLYRACGLGACIISGKLWLHDTVGMETPLVPALMLAGWAFSLSKKYYAAGFVTALLIWVRLDTVVWAAVLAGSIGFSEGRKALWRFGVAGIVTLLPWLIFSTIYFGSPLPHSITAKYIHYISRNEMPLTEHAGNVLAWLTPFTARGSEDALLWPTLTLILAGFASLRFFQVKAFRLLPVYVGLEFGRLVLTRATYEDRYFVPLLWIVLILMGLGWAASLRWLVDRLNTHFNRGRMAGWVGAGITVLVTGTCLYGGWQEVNKAHDLQTYRYDQSLTQVGLWLNRNTPPETTVFLEPLGYAGYYADRIMIDHIGLISPAVADLEVRGLYPYDMIPEIQPDTIVVLCNDAADWLKREAANANGYFGSHYSRSVVINPLQFKVDSTEPNELARQSCYEIWSRK